MNARTLNLTSLKVEPSARRPVRVAVCGEVNSGKSSVINAMVRQVVTPDLFGQDHRPVFHIRHGSKPHALVNFDTGESELYDRIDRCPDLVHALSCEIVVNAPQLAGLELIEVSLPEDGMLPPPTQTLLANADLLVWTTIASQAWRLSERTLVARMPRSLHQRATLVVTRSDKIKSRDDLRRIHRRLVAETYEFFDDIVFLRAARKLIGASTESDLAFERSGGRELCGVIGEFAGEIAAIPGRLDLPAPRRRPATALPTEPATDPDAAAPHSATLRELREMAGGMNGLLSAGIAHDAGLNRLAGGSGLAESTAALCRDLWARPLAEGGIAVAPEDGPALIEMDGHYLLIQPAADGAGLLFLLCYSGKITRGLARNALLRMTRIWDRRR